MSSPPPADITAKPAADQHILHEGKEYTTIKEGLAYILVPASGPKVPQNDPRGDKAAQSVFYNPIQQFNRDLSVLAIKAYGEDVLEVRRKNMERKRERFIAKKNKKRKREDHAVEEESARKANKLEDAGTVAVETEPTIASAEESAEATTEEIAQDGVNGNAVETNEKDVDSTLR